MSVAPSPAAGKRCPSSPCEEGALLLGIVGPGGRVAYVNPPIAIDADFVEVARHAGAPEKRMRFSQPCRESSCHYWESHQCSLIGQLLEQRTSTSNSTEVLPHCGIRAECRWFAQRGPAACSVCPVVVTDLRHADT